MISPSERVIARIEGSTGWLIFNQPERNNALTLEMWQAMYAVLDHYAENPDVRVIVVCGAGDRAFTAGADVSEFDKVRSTPEQVAYYNKTGETASRKLYTINKPTIAMIRGFCMGGGMGIALTCDMRISAASAHFGIPAAKLGLGYSWPGLKMIIDLAGPAFAREILFTGRTFTAAEAHGMGLVNRVVADNELEDFVQSYCDMIGSNAPLTIQAAKNIIVELMKTSENIDIPRMEELDARCYASEDYIEGRRAFLEKRKPVFRGR
ncbi:MAG: enoyl-CoA hydratase/isomerase family protein [Syntrophaceae bacterium]|nr:enoyl-CoA hydratase/isomerase family protein [Syntrophaceae bacterium]